MATNEVVQGIERILNYTFYSEELLLEALTAAGANEGNHEGNRRLAHVGLGTIHTGLSLDCLQRKSSPSALAELKQKLTAYNHLGTIAKRSTIDKYINYCPRSGRGSKIVTGTAVAAILGAVFLDSDCRKRTWEVMQHIGFFLHEDSGVDPTMLQSEPQLGMAPGAMQAGIISQKRPPPPCSEMQNKRKRICEEIASFVTHEREKCIATNTPLPEVSYFTSETQKQLSKLPDLATKLILGIANAQSLVILRQAIQSWRSEPDITLLKSGISLSKAARFNIIRSIDRETAFLNIIKRYHILELFKQCGGHETPSCSGFVLVQGKPTTTKKSGNPHNIAETEVTASILREIHPELELASVDYKPTLDSLKYYRQLGRKFHAITTQFGRGILALLPTGDLPGNYSIPITNRMICNMKEQALCEAMSILEASQGETIRTISRAAEKHIDALVCRVPYDCLPFILEQVETGRILQYPKNSPELISLLE
ncbi:hypothetical protein BDV12DRAFT_208957 [Aspergillus spectabilis]